MQPVTANSTTDPLDNRAVHSVERSSEAGHPASSNAMQAQAALGDASARLLRLHWALANGRFAAEDRDRIRRLVSRAERFYRKALHFQQNGQHQQAIKAAEAAATIGRSAQDICRRSSAGDGSKPGPQKLSVA